MIRSLLSISISLVIFGVIFSSCGNTDTAFTDGEGTEYVVNKVYTKLKAANSEEVTYAAFFPESYTGKEKLPVLFLLDPHAQGQIPVAKYAEVANKQNFILVGSNVHRNGLSSKEAESSISLLMNEVKTRFNVDGERLFIGGFSGGAKLAILYADRYAELKGALACGGSLPLSFDKEPHYYYVGIIGNQDFNYLEMRQSYSLFDQYGFDYTAVVFNGGHTWPPVESFEMGLIGFNIYSAKIGKSKLDDNYIASTLARLNDSVSTFKAQGRVIDEYEVLQQMRRWFYGIEPVNEIQKQIALVRQSQSFNKELRTKQVLVQQEVKLRSQFIRAIESRDFEWWKTEVDKIKTSSKSGSEAYLVKQRMLSYISMASFMLIKNELNDEDLDGALDKIKIYELVDAGNPDVYLMYAKYYLAQDKSIEMLESFEKAKQKGLKNYDSYNTDSFWKNLFNQENIKAIL